MKKETDTTIDPATLASPSQQRWKKRNGFCLVKGCREKAEKGHFCTSCSGKRTRLKAKGVKLDAPVEFAAPKAPAAKGKKPAPAGKKKPAAKKSAKDKTPAPINNVVPINPPVTTPTAPATPAADPASLL